MAARLRAPRRTAISIDDILVVERDGAIVGYAPGRVARPRPTAPAPSPSICVPRARATSRASAEPMLGLGRGAARRQGAAIPADRAPSPALHAGLRVRRRGRRSSTPPRAAGWTRTGHGYEMVRPTLDDIPDVPLPDGLVVRPIGTDPASRRARLGRRRRGVPRPPRRAGADRGGLAGVPRRSRTRIRRCGSSPSTATRSPAASIGKIDPSRERPPRPRARRRSMRVCTRRPWRRRGLARALIARGLVRLRDRGMTSAYLGVDGLNPNQAMTLYSSLGFEIASTSIDWTKPLPDGRRAGTTGDDHDDRPTDDDLARAGRRPAIGGCASAGRAATTPTTRRWPRVIARRQPARRHPVAADRLAPARGAARAGRARSRRGRRPRRDRRRAWSPRRASNGCIRDGDGRRSSSWATSARTGGGAGSDGRCCARTCGERRSARPLEPAGQADELAAAFVRSRDRPPRPPRAPRLRADPLVLPDAPADAGRRPRRSAARGPRAPTGAPDQHRAIFDAEPRPSRTTGAARPDGRGLRRASSGAPSSTPPVGRRLGRRRGRRRRPDLDLGRGERARSASARLARAHQRPPTVAPTRPRPRDHRGGAAPLRPPA